MKKWIGIAATAQNRAVGLNGTIPWYLPEDLRFFRRMTMGGTVIMGRKTWESLPSVLKGRRNIVMSRTMKPCDGIEIARDMDELSALTAIDKPEYPGSIWVIGGVEIWTLLKSNLDELYLTILKREEPYADTFFPDIEYKFPRGEVIMQSDDATWIRLFYS